MPDSQLPRLEDVLGFNLDLSQSCSNSGKSFPEAGKEPSIGSMSTNKIKVRTTNQEERYQRGLVSVNTEVQEKGMFTEKNWKLFNSHKHVCHQHMNG